MGAAPDFDLRRPTLIAGCTLRETGSEKLPTTAPLNSTFVWTSEIPRLLPSKIAILKTLQEYDSDGASIPIIFFLFRC